jgi:thioredoxin
MATTNEKLNHVTADSFESDVVKSDLPVAVDFYADWCGPCKMLAPQFERLAEEYAGRVKFVKVNVDEEGELASRFGISGIPTLVFFKSGRVEDSVVGLPPVTTLKSKLDLLSA